MKLMLEQVPHYPPLPIESATELEARLIHHLRDERGFYLGDANALRYVRSYVTVLLSNYGGKRHE